jgi:hypothetical protein
VESITTEDFIERLITLKPFRVVMCFLLGVDTNLKDLKNGVFLKKTVLTKIHEFLLSRDLVNFSAMSLDTTE